MRGQPEYNLIHVKPLSVNKAYKGRRFKTDVLKSYSLMILKELPKIEIPKPPFLISYEFGMSSKNSDVDNPVKPFQDLLQKQYGFNDANVMKIEATKVHVKKGQEYIKFKIDQYLI